MEIKVNKNVNERHKERIYEVINDSELKNISQLWDVTESDTCKDRVYLTDMNTNQEYSIAFNDSSVGGYNYYIYIRKPLSDKDYGILIQKRPELEAVDREALASVEQIAEGFVKKFIPIRENGFRELLKSRGVEYDNGDKKFLTLMLSSNNNVCHYIVQIMPFSKECIIMRGLTAASIDDMLADTDELKKKLETMGLEIDVIRMIVEGPIDMFVDDIETEMTALGFTVKQMMATPK